jgi:DNA polymerase-3 subunit alpha
MASFVHLRSHSEFSIHKSLLHVPDLVELAQHDSLPALALTDHNNLFGAVQFVKCCRQHGVKPLLGVEIDCHLGAGNDTFSLLLLVQNHSGFVNLNQCLSRLWCQDPATVPSLNLDTLHDTAGLIALSGTLLADRSDKRARQLGLLKELFPERLYVELQRLGRPEDEALVQHSLLLAVQWQLPVVATHPIVFPVAEDFQAHEARACIAEGEILANPRRPKKFSEQQYFKTQTEMNALFADVPSALENTLEIAKRCNLELELGVARLPLFPTPADLSLEDYLRQQSEQGLRARLEFLFPEVNEREAVRADYEKRLAFECDTIVQMGFAGYFLIVADFIDWAKKNGVPVGPGRGSGAGSLVAFCLGITDLDPLKYHLLFERFLNPERVSMPDFDIDFCQDGRDRVIEYVRNKYGHESVSQIATFGTMAAKAAVRDVGRVLDLPYGFVDGIAKLIPFQPGKTVTIRRRTDAKDDKLIYAREAEPLLEQREKQEEEVSALLELAGRLEGLVRNVGMHAGGVLIAPGKLTDFCPLYSQDGGKTVVSQFDKDDVEAVGLVKFDFLGLTTLTILDWAVRFIRERYAAHENFDLSRIALDDVKAFELLKSANTVAVFQLESRGMQDMLLKARPDRFEDIIALVALYRPGPMDLIPDFCERKHGRQRVSYPHPDAEEILQETYGIMVYQEQVMQMAQRIGGYTLGGADLLRRAMGKKKPEEMAKHRVTFSEGAAQRGIGANKANEIFDLMEKFAGYGFNKSHAAAYALLSYQTAYLKAHFPAEFFAANMSCALDDTDKIRVLWEDAKRRNHITLLPPDINLSDYRFRPVGDPGEVATAVRYGLGGIKGTGESAVMAILQARTAGPFTSLFDFISRIDRKTVNRRCIEALVRAGAFDSIAPDRGSVFASIDSAIEWAEQCEASANQVSLFDDQTPEQQPPVMATDAGWDMVQTLAQEKTVFGFSLSGHLFDAYRHEVRHIVKTPLAQLKPAREPQLIGGIVTAVRSVMGRRGKMAILTLDDDTAQMEVVVFGELFDQQRQLLTEDSLIIVQGSVRNDEFSGGLRISAEQIQTLAQARAQHARFIRIVVNQPELDLQNVLNAAQPGGVKLLLELRHERYQGALTLPEHVSLPADERTLSQVAQTLKAVSVELVY